LHTSITMSKYYDPGGDYMAKRTNNAQQQQQQRSTKEKEQDIKNAAYIASINQPNHPNT